MDPCALKFTMQLLEFLFLSVRMDILVPVSMVTTRKHKRHTQELTFHRCFAAYLTYEMSLIFLFSDNFSVLLILFWWGHSTIFHNSRDFTLEFHKMKNLLVIFMHYQLFPFEWLLFWNRMPIFFSLLHEFNQILSFMIPNEQIWMPNKCTFVTKLSN